MEYVRLKYANNKLISTDIKEHREVIDEYVGKKGMEYVGFLPVLFGTNGKVMEIDLIFKKKVAAMPLNRYHSFSSVFHTQTSPAVLEGIRIQTSPVAKLRKSCTSVVKPVGNLSSIPSETRSKKRSSGRAGEAVM